MDHRTIFRRRFHPLAFYACNGEDSHEYQNHYSVCSNSSYTCNYVIYSAFCATDDDANNLYDHSVCGSDHEVCAYDDMICNASGSNGDNDHDP